MPRIGQFGEGAYHPDKGADSFGGSELDDFGLACLPQLLAAVSGGVHDFDETVAHRLQREVVAVGVDIDSESANCARPLER